MKKLHKNIIIFSIVYWISVAIGLILMALSLQKVPIGTYGLRVDYFSPQVDSNYYTNGLYNKGIGYYFVLYPRPKQYVLDNKISVINNDLEQIQITYTLCYRYAYLNNFLRINPSKIYDMYYSVALSYQTRLVAVVNNIISSYLNSLPQTQTRVSIQSKIIDLFNANGKSKIATMFKSAIIVQAIWINSINFINLQQYYQQAYVYSSSASPSYEAAAYNLSIAQLELNGKNSVIKNKKQGFIKEMELQYQSKYHSQIKTSQKYLESGIAKLNSLYNTSRIFNYYQKPSFSFF